MPSVYHLLDPIAQKPHRGEILRSKGTIMTVELGLNLTQATCM